MKITHPFSSEKSDGTDATQVQPSHWNADHAVTLVGPALMGKATAGEGSAVEIALGANLSFVGNTLVAATGSAEGSSVGDATPQAPGVATAGSGVLASREDHVHPEQTLVSLGVAPVLHDHTITNVTGLQAALDGKAPATHAHVIGDVTGLQAALDDKATAAQGELADTAVQPPGLTKTAVGLGSVDNTSDADKPISTATATALSNKTNVGHLHAFSDITGLTTALSGKASAVHQHVSADITDLATILELAGVVSQVMAAPTSIGVVGTELLPVVVGGILQSATVGQLLAPVGVVVATKDDNGDFTGLSMPGGGPLNDMIVIGTAEPVNADGRPNGTIYIKVG